MTRHFIVLASVAFFTGCMTTGNKELDPTAMIVGSEEETITKEEFIARFGEPLATKELDNYTFLGYRKREMTSNAWSIVPFVGLVAGGSNETYTTCIAKVLKATNLVEDVSCSTETNFQSNAETLVGDWISDEEAADVFGAPLDK